MKLTLVSVNVAQPKVLATVDEQTVMSAIGKAPVTTREIRVLKETLEGDRVADRTVHGGADKAVYAYPADNWPWWQTQHALACRPGTFGENLTLSGADETEVRIGDRFSWGDATLEVSQPRQPCFKFQIHTGRMDAAALMTIHARCGWYFRVIREGVAMARQSGKLSSRRCIGARARKTASASPRIRQWPAPFALRCCATPNCRSR